MPQKFNITYVKCELPVDPVLVEISRTTYLENYRYLWDDEGVAYLEQFYSEENFLLELGSPSVSCELVYVDGVPAGFYKIKRPESSVLSGSSLVIDKLYLLQRFTGKQLGKEILSHIEKAAILKGDKWVSLHVMDSSPAKLFYMKQGYKQISETRLTYPFMKPAYNLLLTLEKKIA